jgi:hypothetical protein
MEPQGCYSLPLGKLKAAINRQMWLLRVRELRPCRIQASLDLSPDANPVDWKLKFLPRTVELESGKAVVV